VPQSAFVQSAFEKKSPCTLNDPQRVHRNGKDATTTQRITKLVARTASAGDRFCASDAMDQAPFRLKSRHVRISTGVNRIDTPMIVSIDVAAAELNRAMSPRRSANMM